MSDLATPCWDCGSDAPEGDLWQSAEDRASLCPVCLESHLRNEDGLARLFWLFLLGRRPAARALLECLFAPEQEHG